MKNRDMRPISPLGQQYEDISLTHTFLRAPIALLKRSPSVIISLRALHHIHISGPKEGVHASLPKSQENESARTFLETTVTEVEHWKALFQLLKEAGHTDKYQLLNETSQHIGEFRSNGESIPKKEQEEIGEVARRALEIVFPDKR